MVEDDLEKDALVYLLMSVEFGEAKEEGRDQVIQYFVVVLFEVTRCKSAINGHYLFYIGRIKC